MTELLRPLRALAAVALALASASTRADSSGIDTVYHPYVQPLERDIELRLTNASAGGPVNGQTWRLGYGQSLTERLFAEVYVIGQNRHGGDLRLEGYEFEALWQLTEQGEFAADWAVLGEFERAQHGDSQSGSVMLIGERQWGRLVGTVNAAVGLEQLKMLPAWNDKRRAAAKVYDSKLKGVGDLVIPPMPTNDVEPVYHLYTLRTKKRYELKAHLDKQGVGVGLNYEVPIHLQPIYKELFGYKEGMLPVSEKLCKEVIAIPMFADITPEQQNYVVECVKGFYG